MLTETPNLEIFDNLPHICKAAKNFTRMKAEGLVKELGKVFVKHNVYNDYGLLLLHRHFDMSNAELLVESFNKNGDISVALPWIVNGESVFILKCVHT